MKHFNLGFIDIVWTGNKNLELLKLKFHYLNEDMGQSFFGSNWYHEDTWTYNCALNYMKLIDVTKYKNFDRIEKEKKLLHASTSKIKIDYCQKFTIPLLERNFMFTIDIFNSYLAQTSRN